jgi:hypothetical protein
MKSILATVALMMAVISPAMAFENNCLDNPTNLEQEVVESVSDLMEVVEANKIRQDLMTAKIQYGILAIGVGDADIFLTTKGGKIVDLNVYAEVGILGINSVIQQKVTINQLKAGTALKFEMAGGNKPVLIIEPEADFDEKGGWAQLKIWDGSSYKVERIAISQGGNEQGDYKGFHNNISSNDQIKGLKVHMRGASIPKMYVKGFEIQK